ncbi:MAG: spermidine synthase [Myxococcota bacterium]
MKPWETLGRGTAPDGKTLELRRRGHEYLIRADGRDLMSNEDDGSSKALATLALQRVAGGVRRVLVGGLGMGFTLRAALDGVDADAIVECAELVDVVAEWNRGPLAAVAGAPLLDPRSRLFMGDVAVRITGADQPWDLILLDVDNGPDALAHEGNTQLYGAEGLAAARRALAPGGVLGVWSFSDDAAFTRRCRDAGFDTVVERVAASRKGRGRYHYIWLAQRPAQEGAGKRNAPSGSR